MRESLHPSLALNTHLFKIILYSKTHVCPTDLIFLELSLCHHDRHRWKVATPRQPSRRKILEPFLELVLRAEMKFRPRVETLLMELVDIGNTNSPYL